MTMAVVLNAGSRPEFLQGLPGVNGSWMPWQNQLQTIVHFRVVTPPTAKKTKRPVALPMDRVRIEAAIVENDWNPACPPPRKSNHYIDKRELFYYCCRVLIHDGDWVKADREGDRFIELISLLANNYIGRIAFRGAHHMSNLSEDLIQEAVTKCCLVVNRFSPWNKKEPDRLNNAFAYFTTIIRNRMFETLDSPLAQPSVYLEDLMNDDQTVGDLI